MEETDMETRDNTYVIDGPFYAGRGQSLRYTVRRVINGTRMAVAAETRSLSAAVKQAKSMRTRDVRLHPERSTWEIFF